MNPRNEAILAAKLELYQNPLHLSGGPGDSY